MSDKKYINRLKEDITALQAQNKALDEKLREAMVHLQNCDAACRALNTESGSARKIIWAIAHSQGGSVEIPDNHMAMASDTSNQITSKYDPERKVTIISATAELKRGVVLP